MRVLLVEDHAMVARGIEAALAEEDGLESRRDRGHRRRRRHALPANSFRTSSSWTTASPTAKAPKRRASIRAIDAEAVVLLLTGADDPSIVSDALDAGCSGFVSKDRDVDDLVSAIRAVARGAAVFPADLLSARAQPVDRQARCRRRPHRA